MQAALAANTSEKPDVRESLRLAMRALAKGVVIVAARDGAVRHAMTATAVTPLSFDPPSMLVCVNQSASIYPALFSGAQFSVNLLSRANISLAEICSGPEQGEARFTPSRWRTHDAGPPYLVDAMTSVICEGDAAFRYGTHCMFVGRVVDVIGPTTDIDPLLYVNGQYLGVEAT